MASGPITSWPVDGETMETVRDFMFWLPKSVHGDCRHEMKRCLLLGRKVMTNLDSIFKSRDITLPTKVRLVKAMINLDSILRSRDITLSTKVHLVNAMVSPSNHIRV